MIRPLSVLLIFLASCSDVDQNRFDIFSLQTLEQHVTVNYELNQELSNLAAGSEEIRGLVRSMLDTIYQQEEYLIMKTGGYKDGGDGLRSHLFNAKADFVELNRNNPYGINKEWLNRISEYVVGFELEYEPIAFDLTDDPYWRRNPEFKDLDFFDVVFDVENVYQALVKWSEIKLYILQLERKMLQKQMLSLAEDDSL